LDRLAEEQALARVSLAGSSAREAIQRSGNEVETAARVVAERPPPRRLLEEQNAAALTAFLERFRNTSHLSGCAAVLSGVPFAAAGEPLSSITGSGWRIVPAPREGWALMAAADVSGVPGAQVVTAAPFAARGF